MTEKGIVNMKYPSTHRRWLQTAALFLIVFVGLCPLLTASGETTLYFEGSDKNSDAYQAFAAAHPELNVETVSNIYLSTTGIINALLTGEFPYDSYVMMSNSFDIQAMMDKGYCAGLNGSSLITEQIGLMYEPIQKLLSQDGQIYGAPFFCYIGYYAYDPVAWEAAGLTAEDVPTSFEELLDFLERWVEHIKHEPEEQISVCNTFDSELYGEHSYVSYLVDRLISNYIMQCNYASRPIRFDTPDFRSLLERCQRIGKDLYRYEPEWKGEMALFNDQHGMRNLAYFIPLRMTAEEPMLIKAVLYVSFVNVRSEHQPLAVEYLEDRLTYTALEDQAYLYRDAQPVEDPGYMQMIESAAKTVSALEKRIENMDAETETLTKKDLEMQLEIEKQRYQQMAESEDRYLISPNDLRLYRAYGSCLYFQAPSIFDPATENGKNIRNLRDMFSTGVMPLDQFVQRINALAWMLESETGS